MSLATIHYMGANGVRTTITTESAGPLHLPALEISARCPVYVCSIGDDGGLLVMRYLGGQLLGETCVMPNGPVTQVTVFDGALEVNR